MFMETLKELTLELEEVKANIKKIYANLSTQSLTIRTARSETTVRNADFTKVLAILRARQHELEDAIRALNGDNQVGIVDFSRPPLSVPVVFNGGN